MNVGLALSFPAQLALPRMALSGVQLGGLTGWYYFGRDSREVVDAADNPTKTLPPIDHNDEKCSVQINHLAVKWMRIVLVTVL